MDLNLDAILAAELQALDQASLRRTLLCPPEKTLSDFASNDYLGLSRHPALIEAAREATSRDGTGAGASRLISGNHPSTMALEEEMALWKEKEASLLFTSGYAAALGTVPALVKAGDTILADKLSHACLIDAARLSGATLRVFPHNHLGRLEALLQKTARGTGRVLIITESIFSMDGDAAPLREMVALKERYGAWLLVDEAHATGLYGRTGAGLLSELGLSERVEIVMATMGKALGGSGGMIIGSRVLIDLLINRARSFIYSTALPPGIVATNRAAIAVASGSEGNAKRAQLQKHIAHFCAELPTGWSRISAANGAIQPLLCGDSETALKSSVALREKGFFIPAIRYPSVPRHSARLRVTLNSNHSDEEISALHRAMNAIAI